MGLLTNILQPILNKYISHKANKSLVDYNQNISAAALSASVEVIRDKWGTPHIYAQNQKDLFFAQGYLHAQDRLWQMELTRRVVTGTLSEMIGKDALPVDKLARTLNLHHWAKVDVEQYKNHALSELLESYTKGVNHFIDNCDHLPVEFVLIKHQPATWTTADSLGIGRLVALQMAQGWLHEIDRFTLAQKYGIEKASEIFPQYPVRNPIALRYGIETFEYKNGVYEAFEGPYLNPLGGSNNWVVAPHKMETNTAVLANDPHLLIGTPNIWIENHLECPDYKNTGVSMPGVPLVLIGHNESIAWGATLTYADIQDTYIEKFTAPSCSQYHYGDKILKAKKRKEYIAVKGEKISYEHEVIETLHGPVLIDLDATTKMSLKSKGLQQNSMILAFYQLNRAKNWDDFVGACELMTFPSLNLVYADTVQNIGYYMTGQVPIRTKSKGLLPAKGFSANQEWTGTVPFAEMPHVLNPSQGYFYTCNHKIVADDYPHDLGSLWMNGYRAQTLDKYLLSKDKFTLADFETWQMDFHCPSGLEFAEFFAEWIRDTTIELSTAARQMLDALVQWDGTLDKDTIGGTVYQVIKQQIVKIWLEDKRSLQGRVSNEQLPLFSNTEFVGQDTTAILRLLQEPTASWWNGSQKQVLTAAVSNAYVYLLEELGENIQNWKWGSLHKIVCKHALSVKEPLGDIFDVGNVPIGGDSDTLCQMAFIPNEEYGGSMVGASFRQIIDMGNLDNSVCITPVGQSGNVASPHYADQFPIWAAGEYKPMLWSREQVEKHGVYRMELEK